MINRSNLIDKIDKAFDVVRLMDDPRRCLSVRSSNPEIIRDDWLSWNNDSEKQKFYKLNYNPQPEEIDAAIDLFINIRKSLKDDDEFFKRFIMLCLYYHCHKRLGFRTIAHAVDKNLNKKYSHQTVKNRFEKFLDKIVVVYNENI